MGGRKVRPQVHWRAPILEGQIEGCRFREDPEHEYKGVEDIEAVSIIVSAVNRCARAANVDTYFEQTVHEEKEESDIGHDLNNKILSDRKEEADSPRCTPKQKPDG